MEIQWIKLVGENIWGWLSNEHVVVGDNGVDGSTTFDGWINLATKYVKRSTLPTIEGDTSLTPIGKTATVVNTDSVNVRINGTIYDKIIGKLTRGTTANILEVSENGDWYNLDVDVDHNPKTGNLGPQAVPGDPGRHRGRHQQRLRQRRLFQPCHHRQGRGCQHLLRR